MIIHISMKTHFKHIKYINNVYIINYSQFKNSLQIYFFSSSFITFNLRRGVLVDKTNNKSKKNNYLYSLMLKTLYIFLFACKYKIYQALGLIILLHIFYM